MDAGQELETCCKDATKTSASAFSSGCLSPLQRRNGLRQPEEEADAEVLVPANSVGLVNQLRVHNKEMRKELLELKRRTDQPEQFQHQVWFEGFLLLLDALINTHQQAVSSTRAFTENPCCQSQSTATVAYCAFSQVPSAALAGRLVVVWLPAGRFALCVPTQRADVLPLSQQCLRQDPGCSPAKWVFTLTMNATAKLEDALEEYFMARSLQYQIECKATRNKEWGVECRRICRLSPTLVIQLWSS